MKRKWIIVTIVLVVLTMASASTILLTAGTESTKKHYKLQKHHEKRLKDNRIRFKELKVPKIHKKDIIEIAENDSRHPEGYTSIDAFPAIITDEGLMTIGITEEAKKANPRINEKEYISEQPVWVVTFGGLSIPRGEQTLTEDNMVFDAETGQFLYGFR